MDRICIRYTEIKRVCDEIVSEATDIFSQWCGSDGEFPNIIERDTRAFIDVFVHEIMSWSVNIEHDDHGLDVPAVALPTRKHIDYALERFYIMIMHTLVLKKEIVYVFEDEGIRSLRDWLDEKRELLYSLNNIVK